MIINLNFIIIITIINLIKKLFHLIVQTLINLHLIQFLHFHIK